MAINTNRKNLVGPPAGGASRPAFRFHYQPSAPIDVTSLAVFRILFGLLLAFAMIRFLAHGWVNEFYVQPTYFFPYDFAPWVRPLPPFGMHALFVGLAVLALSVAAGFCYRLSMTLFFLGFTYVELIDQTAYLNHYYLVSLLSGLMILAPTHRAWSIDSLLHPQIKSDRVPRWSLDILRFQIAVVYLGAGLAKLNADWLFAAQPLRIWLAARSDLPLLGPMLVDAGPAYLASWLGAAYDLSIVFLLSFRRTRLWAYGAVIVFHLATWILFRIGIFPWLMIITALLFFPPDWPRAWVNRYAAVAAFLRRVPSRKVNTRKYRAPESLAPALAAVLAIYIAIQLFLPLRHYFLNESSAWTFRGFNCAWRVMLIEKSGYAEFNALDPETGQRWRIRARDYLTPRQEHFMAQDPAMIRIFASHLAQTLRNEGHPRIQIFAKAYASLNGRPSQPLVDPTVDFAASLPNNWITSLQK